MSNRNGAPTENDWTIFALLFGDETVEQARKHYRRAVRIMRIRMALAALTLLILAALVTVGVWGIILLIIAAASAVVGH
jgi:hypothetical protein